MPITTPPDPFVHQRLRMAESCTAATRQRRARPGRGRPRRARQAISCGARNDFVPEPDAALRGRRTGVSGISPEPSRRCPRRARRSRPTLSGEPFTCTEPSASSRSAAAASSFSEAAARSCSRISAARGEHARTLLNVVCEPHGFHVPRGGVRVLVEEGEVLGAHPELPPRRSGASPSRPGPVLLQPVTIVPVPSGLSLT